MARTDAHRPSVINPADYSFVEYEYLGAHDAPESIFARREYIRAHMARTGGTYSHHQHGGNCHVCGAACIYTGLFYHAPTNSYIRTGLDCLSKLDAELDPKWFRASMREWNELRTGKRRAEGWLADKNLDGAWVIFDSKVADGERYEERTIRDIVGKLVQYGSISEKQTTFLANLLAKIIDRPRLDLERQAAYDAAAPIPTDGVRRTVRGTVVSVRRPDQFMEWCELVVREESGFRVKGARPKALVDTKVGDIVQFDAVLKPSRNDPKFGYFSRPTKAGVARAAGLEPVFSE